jgi:hypothetical protein
MQADINTALAAHIARLDFETLKREFAAQDEFVAVKDFIPHELLQELLDALPDLERRVHRNYIPKHKKGGSVSRYDLEQAAPRFHELYGAAAMLEFVAALCERQLDLCPASDPHSFALYFYTEEGDHIGYHYDTSYYAGARYTVLIGLIAAPSCVLECALHTRDPAHDPVHVGVTLEPGMLAVFNGDKVYHRITPLAANERRVALTLEYLTDSSMHPFLRFVSNMKDAIAYFGFKQVFRGMRGRGAN